MLLPALLAQIEERNALLSAGKFAPEYANLSTWINQRRWEYETANVKETILGDGEFVQDGKRYYGDPRGTKIPVPDDATPRPSAFHGWSKEFNDWVML